ncbi:MAG: hypothetical protein EOO41_04655 [Methanobacteriota archaeon]|nr:MAG: hypothetical protein EOO41_04655 [Euryarchaeota archaeon]
MQRVAPTSVLATLQRDAKRRRVDATSPTPTCERHATPPLLSTVAQHSAGFVHMGRTIDAHHASGQYARATDARCADSGIGMHVAAFAMSAALITPTAPRTQPHTSAGRMDVRLLSCPTVTCTTASTQASPTAAAPPFSSAWSSAPVWAAATCSAPDSGGRPAARQLRVPDVEWRTAMSSVRTRLRFDGTDEAAHLELDASTAAPRDRAAASHAATIPATLTTPTACRASGSAAGARTRATVPSVLRQQRWLSSSPHAQGGEGGVAHAAAVTSSPGSLVSPHFTRLRGCEAGPRRVVRGAVVAVPAVQDRGNASLVQTPLASFRMPFT